MATSRAQQLRMGLSHALVVLAALGAAAALLAMHGLSVDHMAAPMSTHSMAESQAAEETAGSDAAAVSMEQHGMSMTAGCIVVPRTQTGLDAPPLVGVIDAPVTATVPALTASTATTSTRGPPDARTLLTRLCISRT